MIHFVDLGVYLWLFILVIVIWGAFYLIKSLLKVNEKFQPALLFFLFALLIHIVGAFLDWYFLFINLAHDNFWWLINPFLNLVEALLLLFSIKRFYFAIGD